MQNLSDIHSALIHRGFRQAPNWRPGIHRYEGSLNTVKGKFLVSLSFSRIDLPPRVDLLNIPESLKPFAPHIGVSGNICYTAFGAIAFDIFNAASQFLACIDKAESVLNDVIQGKRIEDLEEEFHVYWNHYFKVFLDTKDTQPKYAQTYGLFSADNKLVGFAVTDNKIRTSIKCKAFGLDFKDVPFHSCIIKSTKRPRPITNFDLWPPRTVSDFIEWQKSLDRESGLKIIKRLKKIYDMNGHIAVIMIASPNYNYCTSVFLPEIKTPLKSTKHAIKFFAKTQVTNMTVERIDDAYIAERNQPNRKNLLGQNILLVGAGAIGGYLADLLVRGGAGLGNGKLTILDPDLLKTGNIGRHRLGMESLGQLKSKALAQQILLSFPSANIESLDVDVRDYKLTGYTLIINATGEQSISDYLSTTLNQNDFIPNIHVWIEGPGVAVRTMFQTSAASSCYRCLNDMDREPRYRAVKEDYPVQMAGHGCESLYVPFPATAALFAASLAGAHILDWMNQEVQPLLRTIVINNGYTKAADDIDPTKNETCPACHIP